MAKDIELKKGLIKNQKYYKDGYDVSEKTDKYIEVKDSIPKYLGISQEKWCKWEDDHKVSGYYSTSGYSKIQQQYCDGPGFFLAGKMEHIQNTWKRMNEYKEKYEEEAKKLEKHFARLTGMINRASLNRYDRACEQKMDILDEIKKQENNNE